MTVKSGDIWTIYCHQLGDGRRYIGGTRAVGRSRVVSPCEATDAVQPTGGPGYRILNGKTPIRIDDVLAAMEEEEGR
jgi:hypothetical protein